MKSGGTPNSPTEGAFAIALIGAGHPMGTGRRITAAPGSTSRGRSCRDARGRGSHPGRAEIQPTSSRVRTKSCCIARAPAIRWTWCTTGSTSGCSPTRGWSKACCGSSSPSGGPSGWTSRPFAGCRMAGRPPGELREDRVRGPARAGRGDRQPVRRADVPRPGTVRGVRPVTGDRLIESWGDPDRRQHQARPGSGPAAAGLRRHIGEMTISSRAVATRSASSTKPGVSPRANT